MNGQKEDDMSGRLEGKVAAITGAASGFGATAADDLPQKAPRSCWGIFN